MGLELSVHQYKLQDNTISVEMAYIGYRLETIASCIMCKHSHLIATGLSMEPRRPRSRDLPGCPIRVKRAMIDWWGPIVSEYYGGTETGPITWSHAQDWMDHPGTVGRIICGAKVAIIDADGTELPPGERGLIYVKPADFWPDFTYLGDHAKRQAMERDASSPSALSATWTTAAICSSATGRPTWCYPAG